MSHRLSSSAVSPVRSPVTVLPVWSNVGVLPLQARRPLMRLAVHSGTELSGSSRLRLWLVTRPRPVMALASRPLVLEARGSAPLIVFPAQAPASAGSRPIRAGVGIGVGVGVALTQSTQTLVKVLGDSFPPVWVKAVQDAAVVVHH